MAKKAKAKATDNAPEQDQKAPEVVDTPAPAPEQVQPQVEDIEVETAGDYQLFDLLTNQVYAHDGITKCKSDNPFVIKELDKGRLKKVG